VNNTELTDEPCPECGVSLNIVATPPLGTPVLKEEEPKERRRRSTLPQLGFKVCPSCGWTVPA
jgi:predicted RNA-binding Zn-ribbon protein involved in translation (DUF1610 family)